MENKKVNVVSIPPEAKTTLEIDGNFYARLNKLLLDHCNSKTSEELIESLFLIKREKSQKNEYTFNLETLMILLKSLEENFKRDGYTVDNEVSLNELKDPEEDSKES